MPVVITVKQIGKNFQFALRDMDDAVGVAGGVPVAVGVLDARDRRGGFAFVALYDAFGIVEITDGVERHHQWTTIHI